MLTLQWATFIMATAAAAGSAVRIWQNRYYHNRSYKLMRKAYKRTKKKR